MFQKLAFSFWQSGPFNGNCTLVVGGTAYNQKIQNYPFKSKDRAARTIFQQMHALWNRLPFFNPSLRTFFIETKMEFEGDWTSVENFISRSTTLIEPKALFTLQLLTWIKLNLRSTRVESTFVYTAFITKCSVNAKLG